MTTLRFAASAGRHFLLAAALLAGGCTSGSNVLGPDNQVEVNNTTDTFQWQASNVSDVTQTLTYTWANTGSSANVNQSSALSGGSATLSVADGAGVQVYSGSLGDNGTFHSSSGAPGSWKVTVVLTDATGTFNFRLQKP
ncbi:MAG: hypothetical protein AMXMBFR53_25480 [Gemmatimonadota bacterium]